MSTRSCPPSPRPPSLRKRHWGACDIWEKAELSPRSAGPCCLAQADCLVRILCTDVEDMGPDPVHIGMMGLKGAKHRFTLAPVFERLLPVLGSEFSPLVTMYGGILLDLVWAVRLHGSRAQVARCKTIHNTGIP